MLKNNDMVAFEKNKEKQEESMNNQRERLENILKGTNVGTWEWNVQTGENIINERWAEIIGYTLEEIEPHIDTWEKFLHPADLKKSKESLRHVFMKERDYYVLEFRMAHKDGHWVWVQSHGKVISWTDDGRPLWICGSHTDITDRKRAEEEMLKITALRKTLIDNIAAGVIIIDANTHVIEEINREAASRFGVPEKQIVGKVCNNFLCPDSQSKCRAMNNRKMMNNIESVMITAGGTQLPILKSIKRIFINGQEKLLETFVDISNLKKAEKEIVYLSYNDHLTGLYNRRYIEEKINKWDQKEQFPVSVIMADINGLKLMNDIYGHFEGDRLLTLAAGIIKDSCGKQGFPARWGGDEFIILIKASKQEAESVCGRIVNGCRKVDFKGIGISVSLGYEAKTYQTEEIRHVIKRAEDAMYKHKLLERRSYRNTILNSMISTLYAKSKESKEHVERLKTACKKIGIKIGLSHTELNDLELLALLHDIGKISISDVILNKSGILSGREWDEMRKHSEIGCRIAQAYPELTQIAEFILSHHERWDGTGYPRHLKGEEIPLLSRILAVIDAYDAMTNDRVYRKAMTKGMAIEELVRYSGTQFDPEIVKIFIETEMEQEQIRSD